MVGTNITEEHTPPFSALSSKRDARSMVASVGRHVILCEKMYETRREFVTLVLAILYVIASTCVRGRAQRGGVRMCI
jgi:hypothetical protein